MSENQLENKTPLKRSTLKAAQRTKNVKVVDAATAQLINQLATEANKKNFGRRVRDAEIIAVGVRLIQSSHLEALKKSTMTGQDRADFAFKRARQTEPKLSYDEFLSRLFKEEVVADEKR